MNDKGNFPIFPTTKTFPVCVSKMLMMMRIPNFRVKNSFRDFRGEKLCAVHVDFSSIELSAI